MPAKIARSAPRPSLGPPELLVAIHTSRQSCSKAGKARIFALVWESSGESRMNRNVQGLRAVAAYGVVAHHIIDSLNHHIGHFDIRVNCGAAGVDVFFVISGFIMAATT